MKAIGLTYPLEVPDAELSGLVLAALAHDGQVQSDDLRVFVEDGVVTLLGTVDTPHEREQAERLALSVWGVKRVDSRLTVGIDQYLDDDELLEKIQVALLTNPRVAHFRLGARIARGVATLLGRVDTLADRQAAVHAADRVRGVRQVVSALKIGQIEPTDEPVPVVDDAVLLNQVNAAIADAGVTLFQNESFVREGVAHLRGVVQGRKALRRALAAVQRVPGLQGVRNQLALQADPTSRDPDEALAGRVVQALLQDGRVSPAQVAPTAASGMVVLSGQVDSIEDRDAALAVAGSVPGVREVVDDIRMLGREPLRATDRQHVQQQVRQRRWKRL